MHNLRDQILICLSFILILIGTLLIVVDLNSSEVDDINSSPVEVVQSDIDPSADSNSSELTIKKEVLTKFVGDFENDNSTQLSIIIDDLKTDINLVESNIDQVYFSASLYKLQLAVLVYQDVDKGFIDTDELKILFVNHPQLGNLNLQECLNLMIEISDSICAETVLDLYDRMHIQDRLADLINTQLFYVSTTGMNDLLKFIYSSDTLSPSSRQMLLQSMQSIDSSDYALLTQVFAEEINDKTLNLYNKVGISETDWHDVAIIEHEDQVYSLIIMSSGIGGGVHDLAHGIKEILISDYE